MGYAVRWAAFAALFGLSISCGGKSPAQPTPLPIPTVTAISPASGPSTGGTAITITGSNFAAGVSLTIGRAPAINVTVIDSTMIVATVPPHASGPADVVLSVGGRSVLLPGGYTFLQVENAPPVISSVRAQGTRPNEPPNFADLSEEIDVVAFVSDEETPVDELTYGWTAGAGTFIGSGRSVKWRAPNNIERTPVSYELAVTVTEQYQTTDENGAVVTGENNATGKVTVRVHNSPKEAADRAWEFLKAFSDSTVPAERVVDNFSDSCPDKFAELSEVRQNRATLVITANRVGQPQVTFNFGGSCPLFADRPPRPGDACVQMPCGWDSINKLTGTPSTVDGRCYIAEIYENSKWRLCDSQFQLLSSSPLRLRFPF